MQVVDWLDKRASLDPDKVALIEQKTGRKITYKEWNEQATKLARWWQESFGIKKGDRVAILSQNSVSYLDVWAACAKTGAILQNMNWRLAVRELELLIKDAAPKMLLYGSSFLEQTKTLQAALPEVAHWVAITEKTRDEDHVFSSRESAPAALLEVPNLSPDDPWVLCYTGGTTGLPKGAMLTHQNVLANAINTTMSWGLDQNDVAILNAPLFHTGGLNVFTSPLVYAGGTSIVCEGFDVEEVFDLVEHGGVTVFFGVPTMFVMMQEHDKWEGADFSRLKFVISGGAPCPLPVFEKFWAKDVEFKTGYGLTEAGPNTFWLAKQFVQQKPGAVGVPLMHVEVKLIDDEGQEVSQGEVGELLIRGPHVTKGYWNNPDATAKAIKEGWLHTGDLARQDEDGFYSIAGRSKDMIISGGENIYPAEIESVLHGHEAIAEATVIGLPHDKWGEIPVAVVRLAASATLTEETLTGYCKERLARYKVPKKIIFVDDIPKTGAGKIDKKVLVARWS